MISPLRARRVHSNPMKSWSATDGLIETAVCETKCRPWPPRWLCPGTGPDSCLAATATQSTVHPERQSRGLDWPTTKPSRFVAEHASAVEASRRPTLLEPSLAKLCRCTLVCRYIDGEYSPVTEG